MLVLKCVVLSTTLSKIYLNVGPIFTVLPITSSFLIHFRPVKYWIEALDVLYPMVRGQSTKSCFWSGQSLGQTWSTLVKLGQTSPNLEKCVLGRILRVLKCNRTPLRPSRLYPGYLILRANTQENLEGKNGLWQPYRIGWIKKGFETKVTHTCRFSFCIGKNYLD